jgi:hypothetical protein
MLENKLYESMRTLFSAHFGHGETHLNLLANHINQLCGPPIVKMQAQRVSAWLRTML